MVGGVVGIAVGCFDGAVVGDVVGSDVGEGVGAVVGVVVGRVVGSAVGYGEGYADGAEVGSIVGGTLVGAFVDGCSVGTGVGTNADCGTPVHAVATAPTSRLGLPAAFDLRKQCEFTYVNREQTLSKTHAVWHSMMLRTTIERKSPPGKSTPTRIILHRFGGVGARVGIPVGSAVGHL